MQYGGGVCSHGPSLVCNPQTNENRAAVISFPLALTGRAHHELEGVQSEREGERKRKGVSARESESERERGQVDQTELGEEALLFHMEQFSTLMLSGRPNKDNICVPPQHKGQF